MDNNTGFQSNGSWIDPATGEIYPAGSSVSLSKQQTSPPAQYQQASPAQYQSQYQQVPTAQYPNMNVQGMQPNAVINDGMKFCKFCGGRIPSDAVLCTLCGRQVEQLSSSQPQQIVINNSSNANTNANVSQNVSAMPYGRQKNKWVAVLLCLFLGWLGVHRFYEGKILSGVLYLFTFGLGGIGVLVDLIILLCKPNPYYV